MQGISFRLIAVLSTCAWSLAASAEPVIEVAPQPLNSALQSFAEQTGIQVIYPAEVGGSIQSPGVNATDDLDHALRQLLRGTGLEHRFVNARTITVVPVAASARPEGPVTPSAPAGTTAAGRRGASGGIAAVEEITVTGSRRRDGRATVDSAVPVDILSTAELSSQGFTNVLDAVARLIPSYNVAREPISDAASIVRPANLRGLPSDSTLVLINGKRRHRGAVIGEFVSGINKGAQGPDLSPIFASAVKQVDLLRDGAAAQYGSDAIAGVLNFVLQDDPQVRNIEARWGQYYAGDGAIAELSGVFGVPFGEDSFASFAFDLKDTRPTSRGVQDPLAQALVDAGNDSVSNPVVVWGTPRIRDDISLFVNSGFILDDEKELYAFGNWSSRRVDGSFFYRHPNLRSGVFSNDGGMTLLVGDLTPDDGNSCETVAVNDDVPDPTALARVVADPNCFVFNQLFPGGFTPRFGGVVEDASAVVGVRGSLPGGLFYDFSASAGRNHLDYRIDNTVNASLGPASPVSFDLGEQSQRENLINADFSLPLPTDLSTLSMLLAFGAQYHNEAFSIEAGDAASFAPGALAAQGFSVGANGFQGFSDVSAGRFTRNSMAVYVDLEVELENTLLVDAAMRAEHFGDFGDTLNTKVAARWQFSDILAARAAISTGFRAPTVGQSNFRRAATRFDRGQLIETLVVPPTSPIAVPKGGEQLLPEESTNISVGALLDLPGVDVAVDFYRIEIDNRIALTRAAISDEDRAALIEQGVPEALTVSTVEFFVNDFDTRTTGVDFVAEAEYWVLGGKAQVSVAYNHTRTEVNNRGRTISNERARELEDALPSDRAAITAKYTKGKVSGLARLNYYGEFFEFLFNDSTQPVVTPEHLTLDAELSLAINERFTVAIGAHNLLDEFPKEHMFGREPGFFGAIYPLTSPAGFNGGFYYARAEFGF